MCQKKGGRKKFRIFINGGENKRGSEAEKWL